MRLGAAVLLAASLLIVAGCGVAPESGSQSATPSAESISEESSAAANGVDLAVALTSVPGHAGYFDAKVDVSVPGDDPIELTCPGGSWGQLQVRSADTSEVAFDSVAVDKDAIASQPSGFMPDESEILSEGSGDGRTYRFSLEPGRYVLTARTFGPVVAISPIEFEIR